jgi:hypothetical protein
LVCSPLGGWRHTARLGLRVCSHAWLARPVGRHLCVVSHIAGKLVHYLGRVMIVSPISVGHAGENAGIGLTIIAPTRGVGLVPPARQWRHPIWSCCEVAAVEPR